MAYPEPVNQTESATETPLLDGIQEHPGSYVQTGWEHFKVEGRGALFAMPGPDRGIVTVFMPEGETRRFFREQGGNWLRWYKGEVRPKIREYDPKREVVVLTHGDGPHARIVSLKHV